MSNGGTVVVTGATGRQGGAVSRALLRRGWSVRAMTRAPGSRRARALAEAGAQIVAADMDDPASLDRAFAGAHGVYSVQNFMICGLEGEVRQGRNVGAAASRAGIRHLVYGSAGTGDRGTGIGSWEAKLDVEDHLRETGVPVTVLRPTAFMELMTDRAFYPAVGMWHVWPKLAGWDFRVPWLSCHDLGVIAEKVFADADRFVDQQLPLAADVRSLGECRETYARVVGRAPRRFPMPVGLFDRVAPDTARLWRWAKTAGLDVDTGPTRTLHPEALTVEAWLHSQGSAGRRRIRRRSR